MSLYIATLEDEHGMWSDDPIGADTQKEAERLAREKWERTMKQDEVICIYRCDYRMAINAPPPSEKEGGEG